MSVLPQPALAARRRLRLTDAIESVPGAGRLSDLHAAVPSLRGLARGRTLLLAVEVARGPGAVGYGSDALGGAIHARSRQPEPGGPLRLRPSAALGAGLPENGAGSS
jgi:outer membrane receptor protein involved in Fe transport